MDELKLRKDMDRAAKAQVLMADEILAEAFEALEADYIKGWKQTDARDTQGREALWFAARVVRVVQDHLRSTIENGRVAEAEIRKLANTAKI